MRIEANEASYDIKFINHDFENQVEGHEEKKQIWGRRKQELLNELKCSYMARVISDFSYLNPRIEGNELVYNIELKNQRFWNSGQET